MPLVVPLGASVTSGLPVREPSRSLRPEGRDPRCCCGSSFRRSPAQGSAGRLLTGREGGCRFCGCAKRGARHSDRACETPPLTSPRLAARLTAAPPGGPAGPAAACPAPRGPWLSCCRLHICGSSSVRFTFRQPRGARRGTPDTCGPGQGGADRFPECGVVQNQVESC